jgi:surface antigen
MKGLFSIVAVAAALSFGLAAAPSAQAGACGPGMGTGQTVGTLAGAAAGGVIGNQIGKSSGKTAATIVGVLAGGVIGNQAGEAMDAQDCPPPAQPVYVAPAPAQPVYTAPPPPAVVYQPAYPPPPPAPVYIVPTQVTWGGPVWMGPGRDCRSYSQWAVVEGRMQPVYGVACRERAGWRYVRPYQGAWHVDVDFDHGEHRGWDRDRHHDRDDDHWRRGHDDDHWHHH